MINSMLSFVNHSYSSYFSALQSYLDRARYHKLDAKDYKLFVIEEGYEDNIRFTDLHGDITYKIKLAYLTNSEFKIFDYSEVTNKEIRNKYSLIYSNGVGKIENCFVLNTSHIFHLKGLINKNYNVYKINNNNNHFEELKDQNDFEINGLEILKPLEPYKLDCNRYLVVNEQYEFMIVSNIICANNKIADYEEEQFRTK